MFTDKTLLYLFLMYGTCSNLTRTKKCTALWFKGHLRGEQALLHTASIYGSLRTVVFKHMVLLLRCSFAVLRAAHGLLAVKVRS